MSDLEDFFEKMGQSPKADTERYISTINFNSNRPPTAAIPVEEEVAMSPGKTAGWGELREDQYLSVGIACTELPNGLYRPVMTQRGLTLSKMKIETDEILKLPDSQSNKVVEEITTFKNRAAAFKERKLLHKRGIMLWGPPGSGKTSTIQQILDLLINKHSGIAVQIDEPGPAAQALQMIRRVEPTRQIVAIMEDLDALTQRYGDSEYLALLDGESQVDNIVYVATTNYPEKLDKRFVDRPSRFDTIVWIGMPTYDARRAYLMAKEKAWESEELDYLVESSKDFSIAHLRELLILIKCLGFDAKAAVQRLTAMRFKTPDSNDAPNKKQVGFGR